MYAHCHSKKNGEKIAFQSIKIFKNVNVGPKWPFFAPEMTIFTPKMLILFTQNINTLMVTNDCDCRHSF